MVGSALFAWRIAPVFPGDARRAAGVGAERLMRWAGVLASLAIAARLVQQSAAFADTASEWKTAVPIVLGSTTWGKGWILQALALPVALLAAPRGMRHAGIARLALGMALLALCAAPAFSGHAVGAPRLAPLAVAFDTAHVMAAGAWLGTLTALAAVAIPIARGHPAIAGHPGEVMIAALSRFSPIALASAAILALTGAFAAWLHLEALSALWRSDYGLMLVRKLVLLAGTGAAGAYNWKVVTPRIAAGGDLRALVRTVTVELLFAAALVSVTALLVATPLPAES
ncbi:MAG: CopD family protein [Gemmatimonadaceae bacterium]|nr:CopD family protein [Gemmatimonadaceae bacterium]